MIPPPAHTEEEIRVWFSDIVLPAREVWLAESDGTLTALMVLDDDWLDQLYVDVGRFAVGIGSRLVELAKVLRPQGLQLWTFQANTGARRFYERQGFVQVESTDGDNEEGAPDVRYQWRLGQPRGVV
ncbi:MAG TPA: GNAT family N-acetyltransferase [Acidimicrobiales bacterium]